MIGVIYHIILKVSDEKNLCGEVSYLAQQRFWFLFTAAAAAKSPQSCPTLCDPIDSSPTGPLVPGILQARTLEWVAIAFSILFTTSNKKTKYKYPYDI